MPGHYYIPCTISYKIVTRFPQDFDADYLLNCCWKEIASVNSCRRKTSSTLIILSGQPKPPVFLKLRNISIKIKKSMERLEKQQPILHAVNIYESGCPERLICTLSFATRYNPRTNRHSSVFFILFLCSLGNTIRSTCRSLRT